MLSNCLFDLDPSRAKIQSNKFQLVPCPRLAPVGGLTTTESCPISFELCCCLFQGLSVQGHCTAPLNLKFAGRTFFKNQHARSIPIKVYRSFPPTQKQMPASTFLIGFTFKGGGLFLKQRQRHESARVLWRKYQFYEVQSFHRIRTFLPPKIRAKGKIYGEPSLGCNSG